MFLFGLCSVLYFFKLSGTNGFYISSYSITSGGSSNVINLPTVPKMNQWTYVGLRYKNPKLEILLNEQVNRFYRKKEYSLYIERNCSIFSQRIIANFQGRFQCFCTFL